MTEACLRTLRREIDQIDHELVTLLARRFRTVDRVIDAKKIEVLPAHMQSRVDEVIANAVHHAETAKVPPVSIKRLWEVLVSETIAYETGRGVRGATQ